jgi:membrane protein YdbS with pleckstrin-like domain
MNPAKSYPPSPLWVMLAAFGFAVVLFFRAIDPSLESVVWRFACALVGVPLLIATGNSLAMWRWKDWDNLYRESLKDS